MKGELIQVGGSHPYPIVIEPGALLHAAERGLGIEARQCLIVADSHVAPLYADTLAAALRAKGIEVHTHVFEAGEHSKCVAGFTAVCDALAAIGARRDACIVALGGGVTGDLAGFAAACWMRGIDFVQIPTSLLAMVDSSVGGKTGIDTPAGKNLVGAFHFPRSVCIDTDMLATLPVRERAAGFAEVVKYGALGNAAFFEWLEQHHAGLMALDAGLLAQAIAQCCRMKADIVGRDPYEKGERALLNFGHTFGHAIEAEQGYGGLNHGEAVAVGMVCAARLSEQVAGSPPEDTARLRRLLEAFGLPVTLPEGLAPEALMSRMQLDKKADARGLRFIVWKGIGKAEVMRDVPVAAVRNAWA